MEKLTRNTLENYENLASRNPNQQMVNTRFLDNPIAAAEDVACTLL
jgi:hypothetical protein